MIKLIASDMDGTLLNSRGELDNEIYDIINRLKELGIIFTAASGRQLESLSPPSCFPHRLPENGASPSNLLKKDFCLLITI